MTKRPRPTIAIRTLQDQIKRILREEEVINNEIALLVKARETLFSQRSAIEGEVLRLHRQSNAKP